jgi:hypothetical protein
MSHDEFFEANQVILLSIESTVMGFYREHNDLVDHNINKVYEAIYRKFEKELQGRNPPKLRLKGLEEELYERMLAICLIMIGEEPIEDEDGNESYVGEVSKELMIACIKRLRNSIKTWTGKAYGRRGYLDYVRRFIG